MRQVAQAGNHDGRDACIGYHLVDRVEDVTGERMSQDSGLGARWAVKLLLMVQCAGVTIRERTGGDGMGGSEVLCVWKEMVRDVE